MFAVIRKGFAIFLDLAKFWAKYTCVLNLVEFFLMVSRIHENLDFAHMLFSLFLVLRTNLYVCVNAGIKFVPWGKLSVASNCKISLVC